VPDSLIECHFNILQSLELDKFKSKDAILWQLRNMNLNISLQETATNAWFEEESDGDEQT
jgi:hypothetical protein